MCQDLDLIFLIDNKTSLAGPFPLPLSQISLIIHQALRTFPSSTLLDFSHYSSGPPDFPIFHSLRFLSLFIRPSGLSPLPLTQISLIIHQALWTFPVLNSQISLIIHQAVKLFHSSLSLASCPLF